MINKLLYRLVYKKEGKQDESLCGSMPKMGTSNVSWARGQLLSGRITAFRIFRFGTFKTRCRPPFFSTKSIARDFPSPGVTFARGFGAALVVYIAIKAGLTIFSAGTSADPNGYMLLLTCFAGAVFSDLVWDKIKGWVGK